MGKTKGWTNEECHKRRIVMAGQVRGGKPVYEVARIHGVGLNAVYQACRIGGTPLPRSQSIQQAFHIVRLLDPPNRTHSEIARLCDVSVGWVGRIEALAVEGGILLPREDRK